MGRLIRDLVEWEELHDTDSDSCTTYDYSEKVKKCCKCDGFLRCKRVRVDDRSHRVRSIMETIDKLKCTDKSETESREEESEVHRGE